MTEPVRITCALDEETAKLLDIMKDELKLSRSELIRRAIKFLNENKGFMQNDMKHRLEIMLDMLFSEEHVILDIDHWLLFLKLIDSLPDKEVFWKEHEGIAKSHADQFLNKMYSAENVFKRLEACNLLKVTKLSNTDFTLILRSEASKEFIKRFIQSLLSHMEYNVSIQEDLTKLRVNIIKLSKL
ncbi:MAG: ribbon-helix-helix protein, CopG family [Thermoproteota archaeon]